MYSVLDLNQIIAHTLGKELTADQFTRFDVNKDGFVDVQDVVQIIRMILLYGDTGLRQAETLQEHIYSQYPFSVNQSTEQAVYFIRSIKIGGEDITPEVVGAFKNGLCVGTTWEPEKWEEIMVMGQEPDDTVYTKGYMLEDEIPSFVIKHGSDYIPVTPIQAIDPAQSLEFHNLSIYFIDLVA